MSTIRDAVMEAIVDAAEYGNPISTDEICTATGIHRHYVEPVLAALVEDRTIWDQPGGWELRPDGLAEEDIAPFRR